MFFFENKKKLIEEINKLRKDKNAYILAHNYQIAEIQNLADFVGDSLQMARNAQTNATDKELIVVCGADFMAESVKILNPDKKILIPDKGAKCPMAGMLTVEELKAAKSAYPNAKIVLYVNSSAECRALADICCTSANALKVVEAIDAEEIIFGPDYNLSQYVARRTKKKILPVPANGFCYVHKKFNVFEIKEIKKNHPNALFLAHPECDLEVQDIADFIGSTSQMIDYCKNSNAKEFIIGTENGLLTLLQKQNPDKKFYPANKNAICIQQKKISLQDLRNALLKEQYEIKISEEIRLKALKPIQKMLEIK